MVSALGLQVCHQDPFPPISPPPLPAQEQHEVLPEIQVGSRSCWDPSSLPEITHTIVAVVDLQPELDSKTPIAGDQHALVAGQRHETGAELEASPANPKQASGGTVPIVY